MIKTDGVSTQTALDSLALVRDNLGPVFCAYLVFPNVILALANARGFADGVFYHPDRAVLKEWQHDMRQLFSFLSRQRSFVYVTEIIRNSPTEIYAGYDFMNPRGLLASLKNYSFIDQTNVNSLVRQDSLVVMVENLMNQLRLSPTLQPYAAYIDDITSGVILGYPEKAILSSVGSWDHPTDDPSEQLIHANIKEARHYPCPVPIYDYPQRLANDPEIKQHEKLWSKILQTYYTSELHRNLLKDKDFAAKIKVLTEF